MCDGTHWRVFIGITQKKTIETYNSMDVSSNDRDLEGVKTKEALEAQAVS